jgi:hypothetical protein|mmetsp:Transcript_18390/g.24668  ORF Transcript_18390/g.24668 Transcript_18390/m.24668 type:complete len:113 (+) Transcript_18390:164-502(+)
MEMPDIFPVATQESPVDMEASERKKSAPAKPATSSDYEPPAYPSSYVLAMQQMNQQMNIEGSPSTPVEDTPSDEIETSANADSIAATFIDGLLNMMGSVTGTKAPAAESSGE